jgi:hypothetical protein
MLEHLGHERQVLERPLIVECRQDFRGRPNLDHVSRPQRLTARQDLHLPKLFP